MDIIKLDDGILGTTYYPEQIYSGFITASGVGGNNKLPPGWTVQKPKAGKYKIVHNLSVINNRDLRVTATLVGTPGADIIYVVRTLPDWFVIETARKNKLEASAFYFVAVLT